MENQNPYAAPTELGIEPGPILAPPTSPTASRGERDFAFVVDMAAFVGFFFLTRWLIVQCVYLPSFRIWLISFGLTLCFAFLYYYLTEFKTGKSPGKYLARITVVYREGQMPTRKQFVCRVFARLIPFDSFSSVDIKHHRIMMRDKISGTVVVSDRLWNGRCTWLEE